MYVCLTPSLHQRVKFPVSKVQTYTHATCIFDGPVPNILSILCILIGVLSDAHAQVGVGGGGSLNDFYFGTFIGHFPSDGEASLAVKGLKGWVEGHICAYCQWMTRCLL